jgi:hypothetical protein
MTVVLSSIVDLVLTTLLSDSNSSSLKVALASLYLRITDTNNGHAVVLKAPQRLLAKLAHAPTHTHAAP